MPPVVSVSLSEPNDINEISPWDIDFRQIEAGPMKISVDIRPGKSVTLLQISMSQAVHQTGTSPKGMLSVGLIRPRRVQHWQGSDTSSSHLLSFGSDDAFEGVSNSDFVGTTVSINESYAENLADTLGLDIPDELRNSANPDISGGHGHLDALRSKTEQMFTNSHLLKSAGDDEEIVGNLLLAANTDQESAVRSGANARARALKTAIEFMLANEHENLPISRICQETGVSWRSLNRAFMEKFGIGPKSYYLRLRLNRVRSELLRQSGDALITDVANDWAFWHLGQFARDYFKMFGELPSHTLAN
ncbi:MAG: helix-turn-helix domain-containing protein [Roseibium sp.]